MDKSKKSNKKSNNDPNSLTGRHIYRDEKGRVLYYQERTMTGYIIKPEHVAKYRQFSSRILLGFMVTLASGILFIDWNIPPILGVLLGVLFWGFMEYRFRKQFLPNLVKVEHFIPKEKPSVLESYAKRPNMAIITMAILLNAFGILLAVDIEVYLKPELYIRILGWAVACLACLYGLFYAYILIYKKKHSIS